MSLVGTVRPNVWIVLSCCQHMRLAQLSAVWRDKISVCGTGDVWSDVPNTAYCMTWLCWGVLGEDCVGGEGAGQRLDSIVMLPAHALGTAVSSMAGQNIGVRNWGRVKQLAKYGVLYNFAVMLLIGVIVVIFAEYGVRLFIRE